MQAPAAFASDAAIGVMAGLAAGGAYLVAQVLFALAAGGTGSEPLQRIAAILMGPDAAPPPAQWSATAVGMALIIHLPLSMVYGRIVELLVRPLDRLQVAALAGAVVGAVIYVLHRWFIAPSLFPWFDQSRTAVTAVDHVLFGVIAAAVAFALHRRRPRR
jgi:hypothetical protein